jgi:Contractile injection system spike tip protein
VAEDEKDGGDTKGSAMGDFIIKTGDRLMVAIPLPVVVPALVAPVPLEGSGMDVLVDAEAVCLPGDVKLPAALTGLLLYTAPPFIIPGTGRLTLGAPNVTALTLSGGEPIVIKGRFSARFTVEEPAMVETPDGAVPDPSRSRPVAPSSSPPTPP